MSLLLLELIQKKVLVKIQVCEYSNPKTIALYRPKNSKTVKKNGEITLAFVDYSTILLYYNFVFYLFVYLFI